MIIDELIKNKTKKIESHKERFSDVNEKDITFEMFQKKYDDSYYYCNTSYTVQPFINQMYLSSISYWDDKHVDAKSLPRLTDKIYSEIKNFPDYDYLNSVAYEMLIRTREYNNLRDGGNAYTKDEIKKRYDQLGIDMNDVFSLQKTSGYYNSKKVDETFTNAYLSITLKDIDGLDRLIQYYVKKKRIHIIDDEKKIKNIILRRTFKVMENITSEEVKANVSSYFIPVKFDYQMPTQEDKFSEINENIPLIALEQEFIVSIDDLIPNRIKGAIEFNFTRPLLRFKEMPIVDVPLNLNLSEQELIELVTKLKNEFDSGVMQNPINVLYGAKFEFKDLNEITPFKMTKETVAQAFFIYDLYQYINVAMLLHKKKLKQFKIFDIEEIKNQMYINIEDAKHKIDKELEDKKKNNGKVENWFIENRKITFHEKKRRFEREKEEKIIEITKQYKKYSKEYHAMTVLKDLAKLHNLTPYMCKQYLKFMRMYIEKLKYKELIIGTKIT